MEPQRGSLDCPGDEGVGDASVVGYLQTKAADQCESSPRETSALKSPKLEGIRDLKSALTADMEMQGFSAALLPYSLTLLPSPLVEC